MAKTKSFLVIGLGRFGRSIALELEKMGHEVMGVDRKEDAVREVADLLTHAAQLDTTDERAVSQLGVRNFDAVVVAAATDLRASILTTVLCKEMGAKKVICKASDELHAKLLKKVGADMVIQPERETGSRLAHSLVSDNVLDFLELSEEYSISEMKLPIVWQDKTLLELNIRANYGVSIIAIRREEDILLALDAHMRLCAGDVLVLVGANRDLERVEAL